MASPVEGPVPDGADTDPAGASDSDQSESVRPFLDLRKTTREAFDFKPLLH